MASETEILLALESSWVSKEELMLLLGGVSERVARSYIEALNDKLSKYGKCIVSTAARKGYHIPDRNNLEDLKIVANAIEELKSKAVSIFTRRKTLEDFLNNAKSSADGELLKQLSLF